MQLDADFYNLLMETSGALWGAAAAAQPAGSAAEPASPLLQLRRGRAESPAWFLIQAAEFDPEPLTVTNLRVRDVYAAPRLVGALLELMASERWLVRAGEAGFLLAPAGRDLLAEMEVERAGALAAVNPPPGTEDLARRCGQLIEASLAAADPRATWCLDHSRRRAPAPGAPVLRRLAHFFADFNAFRDDAHMAAWRPYGLAGYTWEAFAFVHAGRATTATGLAEQLHYRGYDEADYQGALETLNSRGWLATETGARYTVTDSGRAAHAEAEARTNAYFYAPWSHLQEEEIVDLHARLTDFGERMRARSGTDE